MEKQTQTPSEITALLNAKIKTPSEIAELLTAENVAAVGNFSVRTVYRLADSGRMPRPVRVGGVAISRWRKADILEWIAQGCPDLRARKSPRG